MVSFNLAISMAETGKKVLFIDADLRKSVLIGRYKINKAIKGLTQYLSGVEQLDDVRYSTNVKNMDLILSGPVPPNPAELLNNEKFTELLETARKEYDYVIIDTPPIGQVIDPAIVAQQTDGVIFLISQANISYKYAQKQIEQMRKSGCRILGAVLNKVDPEEKGGYYGGYYGKYSKKGYGYGYGYGNSSSQSGGYTIYPNMIQTDAAINPGNSGGALVNDNGELVGINSLIESYSGSSSGVGFAIPVNYAKNIADQIIDGKTPVHPYMGATLSSVNALNARTNKLSTDSGAYVASVVEDGPAAKAGIQEGDVITKLGDDEITSADGLIIALRSHEVGEKVEITLMRGKEEKKVTVELGSDEELQNQQQDDSSTDTGNGGITDEQLRQYLEELLGQQSQGQGQGYGQGY